MPSERAVEQPIAVVGVACRFPDAPDVDSFAECLLRGHDAVRELPAERWDTERYYSPRFDAAGKSHSRWGGFIDDIARFDARCFGVSPREAAHMDPQQRQLLEVTWHCFEDAGISPRELDVRHVGVFAGAMAIDYYQNATADLQRVSGYTGAGNYACMLANRISHHFGLGGRSQTIDAACASSLVALHEARRSLLSGECSAALVAAASLDFNPYKYIAFSKARMLSPSGRCKTFDASADGYVPGEGVAVVLLEPLDVALAAGHRVRALLLGSAVNHNGAGPSLTAPDIAAQVDVIVTACERAGVPPSSLSVLEAHGTGTSLGDPIEIEALKRALGPGSVARKCRVGSVKSNVGHLEAAAGLAGLIKLICMLERRTIAPTLHVERENPLLFLADSSLELARSKEPWLAPDGAPRRAGVSSFGFGGVNAHLVVQEPPATAARDSDSANGSPLPFALSAHTTAHLKALLERYRAWSDTTAFERASLAEICETALLGRRELPVRVAGLVADKHELCALLRGLDAERASVAATEPELELCFETATDPGEIEAVLGSLGLRAARISSVGAGLLTSLAASGALPLGCLGLADGRDWSSFADELATPRLPLFDPLTQTYRGAPGLDLGLLLDAARASLVDVNLEELRTLHGALIEHQFTFRGFISEWQTALTLRGVELSALLTKLNAPSDDDSERLLGALVLASSLDRLYRKWGFSQRLRLSPALARLVKLNVEQQLSREDAVALLLGSATERAARLAEAQARCQQGAPAREEDWPAPSDWPAAGASAAEWLRRLQQQTSRALPETPATRLMVVTGAASGLCYDTAAEPRTELRRVGLELWKLGHRVDLRALLPEQQGRCALPLYPFAGERHWLPLDANAVVVEPPRASGPLELDLATQPISSDHVINERVVVPGALMLGMALGIGGAPRARVSRVLFRAPAFVEPRCTLSVASDAQRIQVSCGTTLVVSADSCDPTPQAWAAPHALPADTAVEPSWLYSALRAMGYGYGPRLQVVSELRCRDNQACARLTAPGSGPGTLDTFTRVVDGAFHVALAIWRVARERAGDPQLGVGLFVPQAIDDVELLAPLPEVCAVEVELQKESRGVDLRFQIRVRDLDGKPLLSLAGVHLRRVSGALAARPAAGAALRYAPEWSPSGPPSAGVLPKQLILAAPDTAATRALAEQLAIRGVEVTLAALTTEVEATASIVGKAADVALTRAGGELGTAASPALALLWLGPDWHITKEPRDATELGRVVSSGSFGLLEVLKLALGSKLRAKLRVLALTRQAVSVAPGDEVRAFHDAGTIGLSRSAMAESPRLDLRSLDVDTADDWLDPLLQVLGASEPAAFAWRGAQLYRPRLRELPASSQSSWLPRVDGAYLVVGGAGGVGRRLLRWLRDQGVKRLVVLGRSELDAARRSELEALEIASCDIVYARVDVTDAAATARVLTAIRAQAGPIRGVFHCGGVLEDRMLLAKDRASFERVISSKVTALFNLDRLTAGDPLDSFVVFSSVVSLLGNAGQCDYACANGIVDAFMEQRAQRRPEQLSASINWTVFDGPGMAENPDARRQLKKLGLEPINDDSARAALMSILAEKRVRAAVFMGPTPPKSRFLEIVKQDAGVSHTKGERAMITISAESQSAVPSGLPSVADVRSAIREALAETLAVAPTSFDEQVDFNEYGVNSLAIMEIVGKLEGRYGDAIHHSALLEHTTIAALAEHIRAQLAAQPSAAAPAPPAPTPTPAVLKAPRIVTTPARDVPIAILSRACRLPGAANPAAFFDNLRAGVVQTGAIPAGRFRTMAGNAPLAYPELGCFIDGVEYFDHRHFGIDFEEARAMDPQQRIFLELGQELFDAAGYERGEIAGRSVGIFVGGHENEYGRWMRDRAKYAGKSGVVNVIGNMIVGRLANAFDLRGPAQTIFTACSSSLVAVHEACRKLASGDCELAIAGGIELLLDDAWFLGFGAAQVLSADGVCRVFDRGANGFVLGEGAGAVLLKPLERALADGDPIVGVILGSSSNNDGATMGLTTPSLGAQKALIANVLARANVEPDSIGYYEAHGTGTQLGDPIEVKAASDVFRNGTKRANYCALGSVKANIGHSLSAAGIASFIKASLIVERGEVVPTVNVTRPRFDFKDSPFFLPTAPAPWAFPGERRACVSAFGFGGTNCHALLAAPPAGYRARRSPLPARAFERVRCWLDEPSLPQLPLAAAPEAVKPQQAPRPEAPPPTRVVPLAASVMELLRALDAGQLAPEEARARLAITAAAEPRRV